MLSFLNLRQIDPKARAVMMACGSARRVGLPQGKVEP